MKGKKFNMADRDYRDAEVFDDQVEAHKTFFENLPSNVTPLQKEHWPSIIPKNWKGILYDITGFNGQQVVSLLRIIVNGRDQFKQDNFFYFLIRNSSEVKQFYILKPNPTPHQPGNGYVAILTPQNIFSGKKYPELTEALKENYGTDTKSFARDIKKLFESNIQNEGIPEATMEAYMLLLFEIARRLVQVENPTPRKEAFDILPIGRAIARLINLLELRKATFDEAFFPRGKFYCFQGEPEDRRKSIEEINVASVEMAPVPEEEELREMFCPEKQQAEISIEELEKLFDEMSVNSGQEKTSQP